MRFGTDLAQSAKVIWQFCQEGAKCLGFSTPFVSRDHDAWETWPPLGEVQGAVRKEEKIFTVSNADGQGSPCGDPAVWRNGWPGTVPASFPRNGFGLSACCGGLLDVLGQPTIGLDPFGESGDYYGADYWGNDYFGPDYWG